VFIQRCYIRCLASRRASIVLVFYCLQVVVVALIVDWDGLPVWCDIYWFFHGWRHVRDVEVLCGAYDLLRNRVHLLWLWEFWIGISAWWVCWTCWRNPTVLFCSSISVWLPLCRWVICFVYIEGIFFLLSCWSLVFKSICFLFLAMCSFQFNLQSKCIPRYFTASVWDMMVWLLLTAGQWPFRRVNVMCDDLDSLTLIFHFCRNF
jgi:hypothetical protein